MLSRQTLKVRGGVGGRGSDSVETTVPSMEIKVLSLEVWNIRHGLHDLPFPLVLRILLLRPSMLSLR